MTTLKERSAPRQALPRTGDFVEVRGRRWLVEEIEDNSGQTAIVSLACIDDDAQGDELRVLWNAEIDARLLDDDPWSTLARDGADDAEVFAAFLRTIKWRTATAADRDLFQAPFRAGIRLDAYQLAPLGKALRLPRVNLLIADDVGLGKTIEAALVVRELLLRRRIDFILVAAPPSMTLQWQDELEAKFGLAFQVIDREHLADLRRLRGFGANPWDTGSRFIISHRLLTDETYVAGLRAVLGEFLARALLILDEAHHAAPSSGSRYAIDSQFTKAVREVARRFEHRLFLSATPHNGHSNSFSSLLEILDPQRFTRGVPAQPAELGPVMVRRLKADLRALGESFPERVVERVVIDGLPASAPELDLAQRLAAYQDLRERRIARLPNRQKAQARLVFSGLQQRLLSSVAAFARTLAAHRRALERLTASADPPVHAAAGAAEAFARAEADQENGELALDESEAEARQDEDEAALAEQASLIGALGAEREALGAELAAVDEMLAIAEGAKTNPDGRVRWLQSWIDENLLDSNGRWNDRRLIVFTEWEDTRRWVERRLREAVAETDRADERIAVFSGITGSDRREAIKQAFNADPDDEPLRILICTDAAREGINLQTRCYDLVHFDLPWNPSRLEQRNGRIDRKLQPAPQVFCRYFHYAQREEDIVLEALVRKTEVIQRQLGSAGQVIADRVTERLTAAGIRRGEAHTLAAAVQEEEDDPRVQLARAEMDESDARRQDKVKEEIDALRRSLERARKRVGVEAGDLRQVVGIALRRAGLALDEAPHDRVGKVDAFTIDPQHPAFARDAAWQDTFDDLRARRRGRRERLNEWRQRVPPRAIAFESPTLDDGRDADHVVQVHLEHRLVRRLLGRFLSQGFQRGLNRAAVILGPGAQPRVVMLARIALYGPAAARLHEEIIPVTAIWSEVGRGSKPLRPLGDRGQDTTLDQLEDALARGRRPLRCGGRARDRVRPAGRPRSPADSRRTRARRDCAGRAAARRARPPGGPLAAGAAGAPAPADRARGSPFRRPPARAVRCQRGRAASASSRSCPLAGPPREHRSRARGRASPGPRGLSDPCNPPRAGGPGLSLAGYRVSAMDQIPTINRDPDLEWLDLVQPTGLVLSPTVIKEQGLVPERQTGADSAAFGACLSGEEGPALPEPWPLFEEILGWDARFVAGAPGGPALPDDLAFVVPEHDTTLVPDWAVQGFGEDAPWQLLVRLESGVDPDRRGAADGWEASPHQRFERLLRETGALVGVMLTDTELRLIYAPRGETSGWLAFPLRSLATVAGRPMLARLKLLLGSFRLFNARSEQRLHALLQASRDAQAAVSTELAGQVLGALHELLRGLNAAEPAMIQDLASRRPEHLYEGLLTVLLRLVFILYAEDRDLLPSATDGPSRALYEQSYAVRGLYAKLSQDAALNPDTMDERLGGWGGLLALFRMIHKGHTSFIRARRGKLFDPDIFPFLEGRSAADEPPRVIKLGDGCLYRILESLMTLPDRQTKVRQRLSYRTLDVEQIGSVYETIMGFTVETAPGRVLAIRAGKHNRTPVFADLDQLANLKPAERPKYLKDVCKRESTLSKSVAGPLGEAADPDAVAAALDAIADERGSPKRVALGAGTPILQPTEERRRTGSHYTPRTLSAPIVHHALRPILERLGPDATPEQILALKVCDPAMGSGAFLVEACRQLAERLTAAWARHPGTRPNIPADEDEDLLARRLVAQRCLYGVDRNPMAVDLARLSLWLATLARDHEFTFLDHALKAGDSLVGLNRSQIESLDWDTGEQLTLTHMLVRDRLAIVEAERQRIREAVEDASEEDLRPILKRAEVQIDDPKLMADAVIAAFFRGAKPQEREAARTEVRAAVEMGGTEWRQRLWPIVSDFTVTPFHWPLEFPEVFGRANGGFSAIVGNPPFLAGSSISGQFGRPYPDWLKTQHQGAHGNADLVAHFFRRAFQLLRAGGALGLIATKTIREGDTRATGLRPIREAGGTIYNAQRRIIWPGEASVVIATVHILKGLLDGPYLLDGRPVEEITAFLFHTGEDADPARLTANNSKSFVGSYVLGMGFTFDDQNLARGSTPIAEMRRLIKQDPRNAERILPYLGWKEVADSPIHAHHRYVIDFDDMSEDEARRWPDLMAIVEADVKPERATKKRDVRKQYWWRFAERAPALYQAIANLERVIVTGSQASAHYVLTFLPKGVVYSTTLSVIAIDTHAGLAAVQSRVHEVWARFFMSTMKDDLAYTLTSCFEPFPFPEAFEHDPALEAAGEAYYRFRAELMVARNKGLTKTYNDFHDRRLRGDPEIQQLRELHQAMDQAVLRAYGWDDLVESASPVFLDEANEDEFAYQGRLFWPSDFRDEVLARLLALNAERHADEVRRGVAPRHGGRAQAARRVVGVTPEDAEEADDEGEAA